MELKEGKWYLIRIKAGEHISSRAQDAGIKTGQIRKAQLKEVAGLPDFYIDADYCTFISEVEVIREL